MSDLTDWLKADPQHALALRRDPHLAIFNALWFGIDDLCALCEEAKWTSIEQAKAAILAMQAGMEPLRALAEKRLAQPAFDIATMPRVEWGVLHGAIFAAALEGPTRLASPSLMDWTQNDATYALPTHAQILDIARLSPASRTDYTPTTGDCDKQTRHLRGWLAGLGFGNLAVGECTYHAYIGEEFVGAHDLNIAVDDTREVWFLEPRVGVVQPLTYTHFGFPFATRLILTRIEF